MNGGTVHANLGAGTLNQLSNTTTFYGTTGATTVNITGGTLTLGSADRLANMAAVTVSGGTFDLGGVADQVGAVILQTGTIQNGTLTGSSYDVQSGSVSANLGGNSIALTKTTTGAVTLSGANSYTGLTTVSAGTLNLNTTGANAIAGNLTVSGGSVALQMDNQIADAKNVVVSGGTLAMGANSDMVNRVQMTSGSITGSGGTLTSATAFDLQGGTVSAILGGGVGLDATVGTTTLSGANTYTGTTTVSSGTLNLNTTGANALAGNLTVAGGSAVLQQSDQIADAKNVVVSGGTLDVATSSDTVNNVQLTGGSIAGTTGVLTSSTAFDLQGGTVSARLGGGVGLNKTTSGTVTLSGANQYTGATTISEGTLAVSGATGTAGAGTIAVGANRLDIINGATVASAVTINGGTIANSAGAGTLSTGGVTLGGTSTVSSAGTGLNISGVISGGFGLTKEGAGTVTLSGANTYSGVTAINAGTLSVNSIVVSGNASNLGNAASALLLGDGSRIGTLSYTGSTATYLRGFTVNAGGGAVHNATSGQTLTIGTGGITASGLLTVGGAGNMIIDSVISSSGGLTKAGAGTLTLTGTNSYSGVTTISEGALSVSTLANGASHSNIGASSNVAANLVLDGGRLLYTGGGVSIDRLFTLTQNGGTLTSSGSGALTLANSGSVAFSGSGARTLTLGGTNMDQNTLAAGLGNGSGGATGLTKTGAGRWVLTGSRTYTGGTLVLEGTLTLPSQPSTTVPISQNPQVVKDVSTTFRSVSRAVTVKVAAPSQATMKTAPAVPVTVMGLSVSGAPSAINALALPTGVEGVNTAPTLSGAPSPTEGTPAGPVLKKKKTEQGTEGAVTPEGPSSVEKGNP